jgi:hypothetical protein
LEFQSEKLVRATFRDGTVKEFEGERDVERLVRLTLRGGTVKEFKGGKRVERLVRVRLLDGTVNELEGESGVEWIVRQTCPDGTVNEFEGACDRERVVRQTLPDGRVQEFEGEKGRERIVRVTCSDGTMFEMRGEHGVEWIVRVKLSNGKVIEGEQTIKRLIRGATERVVKRWQRVIRAVVVDVKRDRRDRIQTALNRVASRRHEIKRAVADAAKAAKHERPLSQPGRSGPPPKVAWIAESSSPSTAAVRDCKKKIDLERMFEHKLALEAKEELVARQEQQQREARATARAIGGW